METKRSFLNRIRKIQLTFLGHIMKKEDLEKLTLTGYIKDKRDRRKKSIIYLTSMYKWLAEQGLGGTVKRKKLTKSSTWHEDVERHLLTGHGQMEKKL